MLGCFSVAGLRTGETTMPDFIGLRTFKVRREGGAYKTNSQVNHVWACWSCCSFPLVQQDEGHAPVKTAETYTQKTESAARPLTKVLERQSSESTGSTILMAAGRMIQRQVSSGALEMLASKVDPAALHACLEHPRTSPTFFTPQA